MSGISEESTEHKEMHKETIEKLVRDKLLKDPAYYDTEKSDKVNVIKQESHTVDKTEMIPMDEVQKAEFDNLKKGFEDLQKKYEELSKAHEELKSSKKAEEKEEPKEEEMEGKETEKKKSESAEDQRPEGSNEKTVFKEEQPKDQRPDEENQKTVFKSEFETLKSEIAEIKKSIQSISTPRPAATVEVAKADNTALDIALGTKKMTWQDVNKSYGPKSFL